MKQVMEHYGQFILDCMIVVVLMTIIFMTLTDSERNKGIYAIMGAQMEFDNVDYRSYTDFKGSYKTESEKTAPQIIFESARLVAGVHTLSNYIKAVDYAGNLLNVRVLSIIAPDGTEMISAYNHATTELNMAQSGVYMVTLSALDDSNRITNATLQIPMNSY